MADTPMKIILNAVKTCEKSKSFKKFLFLVVRIFNASNEKKKFNKGFQLRWLDTATRRKVDGKTYLQLATELAFKDEGMLDWLDEFEAIKPALEYKNLKEVKDIVINVQKDFNAMKGGINTYQKKTHAVERDCTDNFLAKFQPFIEKNTGRIRQLNESLAQVEKSVKDMAEELREPPIKDDKINISWLDTLYTFRRKTAEIKKKIEVR